MRSLFLKYGACVAYSLRWRKNLTLIFLKLNAEHLPEEDGVKGKRPVIPIDLGNHRTLTAIFAAAKIPIL
jgi:hypothetical protein